MHSVRFGVFDKLPLLLQQEFAIESHSHPQLAVLDLLSKQHTDQRIPLAECCALLEFCASVTGCSYVGAKLAVAQGIATSNLNARCGASASSLDAAIRVMSEQLDLNATGVDYQLVQRDGTCYLLMSLAYTGPCQQAVMFSLTHTYLLLRQLTDQQWQPSRLFLSQPAPAQASLFNQLFAMPVAYNSDFDGFAFAPAQLQLNLPQADPQLFQILQEYLTLRGLRTSQDKTQQVNALIRRNLQMQQLCRLADIAAELNVSPRALQYYLQQKNLTFQQLLDQVRYDLACQLLQNTEHSILRIAEQLGFSGITAFSKAFKCYVGKPPGQYRKEHQ